MENALDFLTAATSWVARNSLETSLLIAAFFLLILAAGRHLSPGIRVALWMLVGARLLLPFAPPSSFSLFNLAPDFDSKPAPQSVSVQPADAPLIQVAEFEMGTVSEAEMIAENTGESFSPAWSWQAVLGLLWAMVALSIFGMALRRQRTTRGQIERLPEVDCPRLRELYISAVKTSGVTRPLRLVNAPSGSGVAVFGFFRETHILIPENFGEKYSDAEIQGILLHELAHVRRRDLLLNWIVLAIQSLHWFNPLVWLASRRFLADRELLCDRAALRGISPANRRDYGNALIKALELNRAPRPCPALVPLISRKTELKHRLTMIANPHPRNLVFQLAASAFAIAVAFTTFTSAVADEKRTERGEGSRESARDGEGERSREGAREGERSQEGARDGEQPREGAREGDRPREGARDGEKPRDGDRPREGARDGDKPREGARDGETMNRAEGGGGNDLRVTVHRDGVVMGDQKYSTMADFRNALRGLDASSASIAADSNTPFQTVNAVVDTMKNAGISRVRFENQFSESGESARREGARDGEMRREGGAEGSREGARDGDRPREGAREGDRPREGARDGEGAREGDRPREGARDGDKPREGAREGDRPREGARDGDKPREGAREGDRPREGARDGDKPREGAREGDRPREGARDVESAGAEGMDDRKLAQLTRIYKVYDKDGSGGVTFAEWTAMKNYELSSDQEKREKGWFDQADANSDEKVTMGEWIDWKASQ